MERYLTTISTPIEEFRYNWNLFWDVPLIVPWGNDTSFYSFISGRRPLPTGGDIRANGSLSDLGDVYLWFSIGPYTMQPGDTLRLAIAFVCGYGIDQGANGIRENAARAHMLYSRNYYFPARPPSPPLSVEQGFKRITLRWGRMVEGVWPRDTTLYHEDATRGDLQWNLISESNRALASGVYIFTVESDFGKQVGKFVLIR